MTDNNINYLAKLLELKDNMPFCTYKEEARWLLENGVKISVKCKDTAFQDGLNEAQDLYAEQVKTEIKHEAYKEFAEKLKAKSFQSFGNYGITRDVVEVCDIDNLIKEIVGDKE